MIRFNLVFIPGLAAVLSLAATATLAQAQPAGASAELARLFQMVCMRDDFSPENTAKLREARNWTLDRKLSGEQGKGSSQKIITSTWIPKASGQPEFTIAVSHVSDRKTGAAQARICGIRHRGQRLADAPQAIGAVLRLPVQATASGQQPVQWILRKEPLDGVTFYAQEAGGGQFWNVASRSIVLTSEKQ